MSAFSEAAQDEDGDIIKTLQARVADLEAQLYAVGAGGVGSPVARQDHPEQRLDMVPAGWKLVPAEPTEAMLHAGDSAIENWGVDANGSTTYRAMLNAAPQPPVVEQPQSVTDCHQSQPKGEPPGSTESAYQRGYLDGMAKGRRDAAMDAAEQQPPVVEQPQVEQEPIGWVTGYYGGRCTVAPCNGATVLPVGMALYTRPQPKREPLTEMEIVELRQLTPGTLDVQFVKFARSIEAAHGVKGRK